MDPNSLFRALWVEESSTGYTRRILSRRIDDLPAGEVLVRVRYSSLNYKDALSATGNRGVTRAYPHTPGIDSAGEVVESASSQFQPGDRVVVMDYDLGANTPGGYGQYIRVPAGWVMPLPAHLSLEESMAYGTAGLTAALSIATLLEQGVQPGNGEVLVTGATGGVGIFAVAMLARAGFKVAALTGKPEKASILQRFGAASILPRAELEDTSGRALLHARWPAAVDTVGGNILSTVVRSTLPDGAVTTCGNVAGAELNLTVFPFILRGVRLLGIDVSRMPMPRRVELWERITGPWRVEALARLYRVVSLDALETEITRILHGGQVGRVVVDLG